MIWFSLIFNVFRWIYIHVPKLRFFRIHIFVSKLVWIMELKRTRFSCLFVIQHPGYIELSTACTFNPNINTHLNLMSTNPVVNTCPELSRYSNKRGKRCVSLWKFGLSFFVQYWWDFHPIIILSKKQNNFSQYQITFEVIRNLSSLSLISDKTTWSGNAARSSNFFLSYLLVSLPGQWVASEAHFLQIFTRVLLAH